MRDNHLKISIRNLIEFVNRSGDLDNRFIGTSRVVEGTRSHQKLQKESGEEYTSEVFLTLFIEFDGLPITLEGRADGIITEENSITIDEIKTTTTPLEYIDENYNMLHWAQAKCYAFIYGVQHNLSNLFVQITYYNIDSEEKKLIRKPFDFEDLKEFFYDMLQKYVAWAKLTHSWVLKRDESIKRLKFPFEAYRRGQRELAVAVYKTITEEKKLFVQAPTGIGKTISTIFPAVKAMGEEHISKIFYLTAKTITRQVAEDAFEIMRKQCGLDFKTITLTAKEKICFNKGVGCNPMHCEYAKGHFDRVNSAIVDILENENNLKREIVERYAKKHEVCPFEFALDLSLAVDCVICDYNYAFDPRVYLKRFFQNNNGDYAFLIDEAHNLVDRSREMFSAELFKAPFVPLKKLMKSRVPEIYRVLTGINAFMIDLRKQCGDQKFLVQKQELKELYKLLRSLIKVSEAWLTKNHNSEGFEQLLELYFNAMAFIKISEFYDERFVTYVETNGNDVRVKLFCLDPSFLLSEAVKRGKSAIYFSATLTPLEYFQDILGGEKSDYNMRLPSPFDERNLCLLVADNVSTKYKNREKSYDSIVDMIITVLDQKTGNYLVYFPSYKYLKEVYSRFVEKCPEICNIVQEGAMNEEDRESFLAEFRIDRDETFVGFGVLGGVFSEGIDLKGDRLIGAIIVGVGLPQVSVEQDIIMEYFRAKCDMGFEYAYMFPGMNKVMQAAGRVIRSEEDRGMVLLIDERFSHRNYIPLFPEHWNHSVKVRTLEGLENTLQGFW